MTDEKPPKVIQIQTVMNNSRLELFTLFDDGQMMMGHFADYGFVWINIPSPLSEKGRN